ncbi:MAG: 4-diphosphocytidyl-2C-methyl-D-erythritolkinase [Chloroflexi bacterium]|nr:4-diphosphocytidyl-2C-methyl-D-erythritolkinase [Chloroflexota bacterium]
MTRSVSVEAFAKINLSFEVIGRRSDGMHEVATVLQTISLADHLSFSPAGDVVLVCDGMPVTPDNLILRAAHLLGQATGNDGCWITCLKRIPVAGGLGGGSADAGATLRGLNALWRSGFSRQQLAALSSSLGADVPFAVHSGTALATGIGTSLALLPDAPHHWMVLVPLAAENGAKTREMYQLIQPDDFTDGSRTAALALAISQGRLEYEAVESTFTRYAIDRWAVVGTGLDVLRSVGAAAASVSGAGPSFFGLFDSRATARAGVARVAQLGLDARVTRFVPGDMLPRLRASDILR